MNVEVRDEARDDLVEAAVFTVSNLKAWLDISCNVYEKTLGNLSQPAAFMNNTAASTAPYQNASLT